MPEIRTEKNNRASRKDTTNKDAFIKSIIFSLLVYSAVYIISCFCALTFDIRDSYDFYISLLSFAAASFISGFYSGNKLRKNGLVTGLLFTLPVNALIILISVVLTDFKPGITLLITALVLLLSSAAGGIFAVNKRHRR